MKIKSSKTERRHLLIAWVLISMAFAIALSRGIRSFPAYMLLSLVTIGPAFLFHEMAHKLVAQRYGCWAEFRMSLPMLIFTLIIAFTGFVIAAPGAVMISGYNITRSENGKISVAGPLTNLALLLLFLPISFIEGFIGSVGMYGSLINALIAAFNMIPFGMLDGRKVFAWNKTVYITVAVVAFAAVVVTMRLMS
jgi:Zn-dependent protease